jgi:hypothetical protein
MTTSSRCPEEDDTASAIDVTEASRPMVADPEAIGSSVADADQPLREHIRASVATVAREIHQSSRRQLDALRASLEAVLGGLDRPIAIDTAESAFEGLIREMWDAATRHADAVSTRARLEAEESAARAQAARDEVAADLSAARAQLNAARAEVESTRAEFDQRLGQAVAAAAEATASLADLEAQHDTARLEWERRLADSARAQMDGALAAAEAESLATTARQDAERCARALDEARSRLTTLDRERTELVLARDLAEGQLEDERQDRLALVAQLDAAREQVGQLRTDAEVARIELARLTARIRELEHARESVRSLNPPGTRVEEVLALLDGIRVALHTLTESGTGARLVDALLDVLAPTFARAAFCVVGPAGCVVSRSRGFDPRPTSPTTLISLAADTPLAHAWKEGRRATVTARDGETLHGLLGSPIGSAVALPLLSDDRGVAMLYAENPPVAAGDPEVAARIAEMLADQVARRLRLKQSPREPPMYLTARQARRIRLEADTAVVINGTPSTLVDLSTLGAQVVSPGVIRPNHALELALSVGHDAVSCTARVVWVRLEQSADQTHSVYRAGVEFTNLRTGALDPLFTAHRLRATAVPSDRLES